SRGRTSRIHDSSGSRCDAFTSLRHLQRLRALRERSIAWSRGVSRFLKYQYKKRDRNAPGNIKDWIARLNKIRKENRALQGYTNLRFHDAENDAILFYSKMTAARDNIILVVVNLDPHRKQNSFVYVPIESFGQMESDAYQVQDLVSGATYTWRGRRNYVELDPDVQPAHVFLVRR